MSDDFFTENKRDIEAYAKWIDETLSDENEKTDPVRDLIFVSKGHYIKSKLIARSLNEAITNKYGNLIPFAIKNLGNTFISTAKAAREKDKDKIEVDIDTIMNFLGQAAQEVQLRKDGSPSITLSEILNYFFYSEYRTDEEKVLSVYLTGKLPLLIYASVVNEDKSSITNQLKTAEEKVIEWNSKLDNLDSTVTKVKNLEQKLEEQKISFNFLGLSAAFNKIYESKRTSLYIALASLLLLGILILAVPAVTLFSINSNLIKQVDASNKSGVDERSEDNSKSQAENIKYNEKPKTNDGWLNTASVTMPIIAIEIILLYFFRILLQHYNSSRSQIMQLQMRNAICQFIETYIKFKEEHKEHKDSFEKFESQIFSGLAPNDEAIPGTFDGIEQLGKLVKTLKG